MKDSFLSCLTFNFGIDKLVLQLQCDLNGLDLFHVNARMGNQEIVECKILLLHKMSGIQNIYPM